MNRNVMATFDDSKPYRFQFRDDTWLDRVRIVSARTGEEGQILALIAQTTDPTGLTPPLDVVINWDNVLYVRELS